MNFNRNLGHAICIRGNEMFYLPTIDYCGESITKDSGYYVGDAWHRRNADSEFIERS